MIQSIKWNFTRNYKALHSIADSLSGWQDRFWDHVIRDDRDLGRHIDYIHYNPVKHGLAGSPAGWRFSTSSTGASEGTTRLDGAARSRRT